MIIRWSFLCADAEPGFHHLIVLLPDLMSFYLTGNLGYCRSPATCAGHVGKREAEVAAGNLLVEETRLLQGEQSIPANFWTYIVYKYKFSNQFIVIIEMIYIFMYDIEIDTTEHLTILT